jgi:hypothetical protein
MITSIPRFQSALNFCMNDNGQATGRKIDESRFSSRLEHEIKRGRGVIFSDVVNHKVNMALVTWMKCQYGGLVEWYCHEKTDVLEEHPVRATLCTARTFFTTTRPASWPTQPLLWLSPAVKRQKRSRDCHCHLIPRLRMRKAPLSLRLKVVHRDYFNILYTKKTLHGLR